MNQGRIWCVVNPTVGLPLFLGSVALMSFTVHFAVLSSSTWVTDFFNGVPMKKAAVETDAAPLADVAAADKPVLAIEVAQAPEISSDGSTAVVLKIKPKVLAPDPG
jgi:light-harvesting protein B-800-850 alpha chain